MLNVLAAQAFKNSWNKGFYGEHPPFEAVTLDYIRDVVAKTVNVGEKIALMHTELSEAFEEVRTKPKYMNDRYLRLNESYAINGYGEVVNPFEFPTLKPEGVAIELADLVIRVLDFCGAQEIDLEAAIKLKMAYNATRPHKHGKLL